MSSANILLDRSEGSAIRSARGISGARLSGAKGGRMAKQRAMRPMLTRRRAVDYCRVATAQCPAAPRPAMPRQGDPA